MCNLRSSRLQCSSLALPEETPTDMNINCTRSSLRLLCAGCCCVLTCCCVLGCWLCAWLLAVCLAAGCVRADIACGKTLTCVLSVGIQVEMHRNRTSRFTKGGVLRKDCDRKKARCCSCLFTEWCCSCLFTEWCCSCLFTVHCSVSTYEQCGGRKEYMQLQEQEQAKHRFPQSRGHGVESRGQGAESRGQGVDDLQAGLCSWRTHSMMHPALSA